MVGDILTIGFLVHIGLTIVNWAIAVDKKKNIAWFIFLSAFFFAPFVYLYLLATPEEVKK